MFAVALIDTLKRSLKGRAITYAVLGKGLGLSEASVKRMFSRRDFTLHRMEEICRIAGLDFGELAREATAEAAGITHLTVEQEDEIVSDPKLMLIALCAVGNWTLEQIVDTYDIPRVECIRCLARLDRRRIIELAPDNRIRPLISRTFSWLPDGRSSGISVHESSPSTFPRSSTAPANSSFRQRDAFPAQHSGGYDTDAPGRGRFCRFHATDRVLPLSERHGTSMLLAIRPWEPRAFQALRRKDRAAVPAGQLLNPMHRQPVPLLARQRRKD